MSKRELIGPAHPNFRSGKSHDANGYVTLSSKAWGRYCNTREHRMVMEHSLERALRPDEIVHHINGDKSDNSIQNLRLETRASHNRAHGSGQLLRCASCGKERWYGPALIKRIAASQYQCRPCRFGKDWDNGRRAR